MSGRGKDIQLRPAQAARLAPMSSSSRDEESQDSRSHTDASGAAAASASAMVVAQTPVYTFGKNNYSQLGLEHADASIGHIDQQDTPQLLRFFRERRVVHVACGYEHSLVVTESNEVFGFGRNDNAQLGLGHTNNSHNTPQRVPALCGKDVALLRCGAHFALTVTADGEVFGHGANRHGQLGLGHAREQTLPVRVPALSGKGVHAIACGGYHSLVATRRRELFVFGKNERSQLGLGDKYQRVAQVETPTRLEELCGMELTHVAGGFRHSVVAAADGQVYGFGNNRYGELGMGDAKTDEGRPLLRVSAPRAVPGLAGREVVDLACGEYHTVAVLSGGDVVSFGYNGCGQLGLGHTDSQAEPTRIEPLCQKRVWAVECGYYHTVALTEEGSVFAFGYNANGMLGLGHTDEMLLPAQLPGLRSPQMRIAALCRSHHTIMFQAAQSETPASNLAAVLATGGDVAATTAGIVQSVLSAALPQEKPSEVGAVVKVLSAACAQAPALARTLGEEVAGALQSHNGVYKQKVLAAHAASSEVSARMIEEQKQAESAQARIARLQRRMKELEREMVAEEATLERKLAGVRLCHREQAEQREVVKLLGVEGQRLKVLSREVGRLSSTEPVEIYEFDPDGGSTSGAVEAAAAAAPSVPSAAPQPPGAARAAVAARAGLEESAIHTTRSTTGVTPGALASQFRELGLEAAAGLCERERIGSRELTSLGTTELAAKLGFEAGSEEMQRVTEVLRQANLRAT